MRSLWPAAVRTAFWESLAFGWRKWIFLSIAILLSFLIGAILTNKYLIYTHLPGNPVDCIILLYGPEFQLRKREAERLTKKGLANVIYSPLTNRVRTSSSGNRFLKSPSLRKSEINYWKLRKRARLKHLENTHLELLVAKSFVEKNRMKRILIVSSPYHMRRVKLIADRLFGDAVQRYYASPGNHTPGFAWMLSWREVRWVCKESTKIAWFLFYWHLMPTTPQGA